jgi:hypothetical protein
MRRQYFFPGRPGQGKPACPAGKQVLNEVPLSNSGKY